MSATSIMVGHVLDRLRDIADESVHMVWTSPPYYGLRAYGTEPQVWGGDPDCRHRWGDEIAGDRRRGQRGKTSVLVKRPAARSQVEGRQSDKGAFCLDCAAWSGEHGQEPSLDMWIEHEVQVFHEVRRVLRKDGTLWINCGDAYSQGGNGGHRPGKKFNGHNEREGCLAGIPKRCPGFKPKQRLMLPARLAIALQDDGWWLRDEIVWHKRNPMPSSVEDRTAPAHEMLYMLSKSPRYFYDDVAIREPAGWNPADTKMPDGWATHDGAHGSFHREGREKGARRSGNVRRKHGDERGRPDSHVGGSIPWEGTDRKKRSVWSLASEPCKQAHFATAPTALIVPCVLAGTSRKGVCAACEAPWVRAVEETFEPQSDVAPDKAVRAHDGQKPMDGSNRWSGSSRGTTTVRTVGWKPSCRCPAHEPIAAMVLDPFGGAGTTGLVAGMLGRACTLIELNPEYAAIAESRIGQGLVSVGSDLPESDNPFEGMPLFEGAP